MQTVSWEDNLHEMPNHIFLEKIEKYHNLSYAEIFTQNAMH